MNLKSTIATALFLVTTATAANAGNNRYLCEFTLQAGETVAIGKVASPDMASLKNYLSKIPGRGEARCSKGVYGTKKTYFYDNLIDLKPRDPGAKGAEDGHY